MPQKKILQWNRANLWFQLPFQLETLYPKCNKNKKSVMNLQLHIFNEPTCNKNKNKPDTKTTCVIIKALWFNMLISLGQHTIIIACSELVAMMHQQHTILCFRQFQRWMKRHVSMSQLLRCLFFSADLLFVCRDETFLFEIPAQPEAFSSLGMLPDMPLHWPPTSACTRPWLH